MLRAALFVLPETMSCGIGQAEDMCSAFERGNLGSASRSSPAPGGTLHYHIRGFVPGGGGGKQHLFKFSSQLYYLISSSKSYLVFVGQH